MLPGSVAGGAGEVESVSIHVDTHRCGRLHQRRVKVSMLGTVTRATVEVAGSACLAAGLTDAVGDLRQIYFLAIVITQLFVVAYRTLGTVLMELRKCIGSGRIVADQAVDLCLLGKVEVLVRPVVADMAKRAVLNVGLQ